MPLIKSQFSLDRYIITPPTRRSRHYTGPTCQTCLQEIMHEEIVDGHDPGAEDMDGRVTEDSAGDWIEVRVKHHGAEHAETFRFGSNTWGPTELRKYMQRAVWFPPLGVAEAGSVQK